MTLVKDKSRSVALLARPSRKLLTDEIDLTESIVDDAGGRVVADGSGANFRFSRARQVIPSFGEDVPRPKRIVDFVVGHSTPENE